MAGETYGIATWDEGEFRAEAAALGIKVTRDPNPVAGADVAIYRVTSGDTSRFDWEGFRIKSLPRRGEKAKQARGSDSIETLIRDIRSMSALEIAHTYDNAIGGDATSSRQMADELEAALRRKDSNVLSWFGEKSLPHRGEKGAKPWTGSKVVLKAEVYDRDGELHKVGETGTVLRIGVSGGPIVKMDKGGECWCGPSEVQQKSIPHRGEKRMSSSESYDAQYGLRWQIPGGGSGSKWFSTEDERAKYAEKLEQKHGDDVNFDFSDPQKSLPRRGEKSMYMRDQLEQMDVKEIRRLAEKEGYGPIDVTGKSAVITWFLMSQAKQSTGGKYVKSLPADEDEVKALRGMLHKALRLKYGQKMLVTTSGEIVPDGSVCSIYLFGRKWIVADPEGETIRGLDSEKAAKEFITRAGMKIGKVSR